MTNTRRKQKPVSLKIVGLILSESYQRSRLFAEKLHKHNKKNFLPPSITGMLDMDWVGYLKKLQKEKGGKTRAVKNSVVVFLNDSFLGSEKELFNRFENYLYKGPTPEMTKASAEREYRNYLNRENLLYVYMDLSLDDDYMGTLLFQLRYDCLPRSSLWFTEFCTHELFTYRGTQIHRVCKGGWFQAGEIKCNYQREYIEDENYSYKHDRRGILSFANDAKHKNKYQFTVTFGAAEWMDGKYVAFGRVVEGSDVLRRIENTPCTYEKPDRTIKITRCGLADVGLGRAIDTHLRVKGITVGEPHLHLEFFVELLFEKFDEILFERLDEEVKAFIGRQWLTEMIWNSVVEEMAKRRPSGDDVIDVRDESSQVFVPTKYLTGLYSVPDIPDVYIRKLLKQVVEKAMERGDIVLMARSIVNFLANCAFDEATVAEQVVEGVVESLVKTVLNTIFGSESSLEEVYSKSSSSTGTEEGTPKESVRRSLSHVSRTESIVAYVWSLILDHLGSNTNVGGES